MKLLNLTYDLSTVQGATDFVRAEHTDEDSGGDPHSAHVLRVAAAVQADGGTDDQVIAALLHDSTEDTHYTLADLSQMGASVAVTDMVDALDHRNGEDDLDYLKRLVLVPGAAFVKLRDNSDNLDPVRMSLLKEGRRQRSIVRKTRDRTFLLDYVTDEGRVQEI